MIFKYKFKLFILTKLNRKKMKTKPIISLKNIDQAFRSRWLSAPNPFKKNTSNMTLQVQAHMFSHFFF